MLIQDLEKACFEQAGRIRPDPVWRMHAHTHPFHELVCVMRGRIHVLSNRTKLACSAGDVLLYPAGTPHEEWTDADDPLESLFIGFTCHLDTAGIIVLNDRRGRIAEMFRWLYEDTRNAPLSSRHEHDTLLAAILAECECSMTEPVHAWVERVRSHVQNHLSEPLALGALAGVARLSLYHFARAFKHATGQSPMAAVRTMRLQHARQLILSTSLPLKEIAVLSGLGNAYSLSRTFKQCLGIPPGKLRRFHREVGRGRKSATGR